MGDVHEDRRVKTRMNHWCAYCGEMIPSGSDVRYEHGVFDGEPYSRWCCGTCEPRVAGFWEWCGYECENIRESFEGYLEEAGDEGSTKEDAVSAVIEAWNKRVVQPSLDAILEVS